MKKIIVFLFLSSLLCNCKDRAPKSICKESSFNEDIRHIDSLYVQDIDTDTSAISKLLIYNELGIQVIYEKPTMDGSSIDFVEHFEKNGVKSFDCFAIYDATVDGQKFLFFDYINRQSYIMYSYVAGFYPIVNSVDLTNKRIVLLNNYGSKLDIKDTLDIGKSTDYVPYNSKVKFIKAKLYQLSFLKLIF